MKGLTCPFFHAVIGNMIRKKENAREMIAGVLFLSFPV
jgi:hypothetical protein